MKKVIIFSEFSEMCKILNRELKRWNPLMIIGEISSEGRKKVVEEFKTDPEKNLLIMSSAGAFGLNLQVASVIIHYDQPWSLSKMQQRDGRAHRIGQKDSVLVYNLLAKGTVDYYVKKVIHGKAELSNKILGDVPITMTDITQMLKYEL